MLTFDTVDTIFSLLPHGVCGFLAVVMAYVCFEACHATKSWPIKLLYVPLAFAFVWTAALHLVLSLLTLPASTLQTICEGTKFLAL